jgi:uncharacterized membrane protein
MSVAEFIEVAGTVIDVIGVAVIVLGAIVAVVLTWARRHRVDVYEYFRRQLGRAILLGLEFLVAADIIRTVAAPDAESVAILAGIVAIRTFLSFSLQLEMTGRWPWQSQPTRTDADTDPERT